MSAIDALASFAKEKAQSVKLKEWPSAEAFAEEFEAAIIEGMVRALVAAQGIADVLSSDAHDTADDEDVSCQLVQDVSNKINAFRSRLLAEK